MRATRRGILSQKVGRYVWAVYPIKYVIDESSATTGSFSMRSTYKKMAATAYTTDGTTFTLTSPVSTAVTSLAGKYIVNISTATNTSTSGSTIYYVNSVSTSGTTRTVSYTAYTATKEAQGDGELYRIESKTPDYPVDGVQNGYWYVMLAGEYDMHVWDVYNATAKYVEKTESNYRVSGFSTSTTVYYNYSSLGNKEYTFDASTGVFTLASGYKTAEGNGTTLQEAGAFSGHWLIGAASGTEIYDGVSSASTSFVTADTRRYAELSPSKNEYTGQVVESADINAYPQDYYQDGYWYTYSHKYTYRFDNT